MKTNIFDEKIYKDYDLRRKWDFNLIKEKFGNDVPEDFIPLWIADMDFELPEILKQKLKDYIDKGSLGYTSLTPEFYNSIISWQKKRHGIDVKKEWINIAYGTVGILHVINQTLLEKGDYVLINTPVYEPFMNSTINNGNKIIDSPLIVIDNRYYINFEDLENKMKEYKPKVYILCNSHNPSGRIWSKEELIKISDLCLKYKVILISDEVHSEMDFKGKHTSSLSLEEKYIQNLIFLTSPNKAFNLGGLKTSYTIIPNESIRNKLKEGMKKNSITSPNILGLVSLVTVYNECEYWLDELNEYIYKNYIYFKEFCYEKYPKFNLYDLESSYLLWIDLSNTGKDSKWWTENLSKVGIIVEDGNDFIKNGKNYIRINIGIPIKYLKDALLRIEKVYELI